MLRVSARGEMVTPDKSDAADREMAWNNGVDASTPPKPSRACEIKDKLACCIL